MWTVSAILQEVEREIKVNGQTGEGDIYLRFSEGKGTERGLKQATHTLTHTHNTTGALIQKILYSSTFHR